jgi:hypothetical protein
MYALCTIRPLAVALLAGSALAVSPACSAIDPQVGDLVADCSDADSNPGAPVSFKDQIRPLIAGLTPGVKGCNTCHYPGVGTQAGLLQSGLDLSSLGTLRAGGRVTGGGVVVPGSPCKSGIVKKLRGVAPGARMPKDGPFWTPEQIQLLKDWIAEGAKGDAAE